LVQKQQANLEHSALTSPAKIIAIHIVVAVSLALLKNVIVGAVGGYGKPPYIAK
jgi:hypothetical protein